MIKKFTVFFASLLLALSLVAGQAYAQRLDRIVAVVDDDVVLESELEQFVASVRSQARQAGQRLPGTSELRQQALDRLVINRLQVQRAERAGLNISSTQVTQAAQDIAKRNGQTLPEFIEELERNGVSYSQFRRDLREEIMTQQLRARQVENRVKVSEREIEDALSVANSVGGQVQYRIGHIMVAVPRDATPEEAAKQEDKIKDIQNRLQGGADFAETAVAFSDGQRALEGGDLGWRQLNQLPTIFVEPAKDLNTGQISKIVRSPTGFHIIKLMEERNPNQQMVVEQKLSHILIKTNAVVDNEKAREQILALRAQVESGADFGELAKEYSDDPGSGNKGGNLGWVSPGMMVPEFEKAARQLLPNELSDPVRSQFGWHLILAEDQRERDATNDVLRSTVRQQIYQRKLAEETEAWMLEMRDRSYVEIRL